ncbi:MAG: hypothetical protein CVT49_04710 [candidate division Zixibacteria bacterium HGW-Zixibacteria-1]|nr:MAG: hypothetical protein CVT49_04710 [candidate division Zixibacteria bacterium HGW-Zixibacteria-1]
MNSCDFFGKIVTLNLGRQLRFLAIFLVTLLLVFFSANNLMAESASYLSAKSFSELEWTHIYEEDTSEYAVDIQPTFDKGYILLSVVIDTSDNGCDVNLRKLDSTGNVEWRKRINNGYELEGRSVCQTYDSGFVFVSAFRLYLFSNIETCVIKTNKNGDIVWTQYHTSDNYIDPYKIVQTTNRNLAITGTYGTLNQDNLFNPFLLKLNSLGTSIWLETYGDSLKDKWTTALLPLSDGGFVMAGATYSTDWDALIIRVGLPLKKWTHS